MHKSLDVMVNEVMKSSDEVVRLLGQRFGNPLHAVAVLAVTLGRICVTTGAPLENALVLARVIAEDARENGAAS